MFSLSPTIVLVPVTLYAAPSPSANPSPLTVTSSFVNGVPSYVFVSVALVSFTFLFAIFSVPFFGVTENSSVTSLPAASFTTGVPTTFTGYSPASVFVVSALRPSTVNSVPSIVNVSVLKPSAVCSFPSYVDSPLLASTSISYFASLLVTVRVPYTVLIV